jgi:hypothetical protein
VSWIVGAAAVLLIVLLAIAWIVTRPDDGPEIASGSPAAGSQWALVVDMGCEPQDLQRVLKKADQYPEVVRPVAADSSGNDPCWQLVWGEFSSRSEAEKAADRIPESVRKEGFQPHAVELVGDEVMSPPASGE